MKNKKEKQKEENYELYQMFNENTKMFMFPKGVLNEKIVESITKSYYKVYPRFKKVNLSVEPLDNRKEFENVLLKRRSTRVFNDEGISFSDLSRLLLFSAGVFKTSYGVKRTYPSAGARYPLEIYPIIFRSSDLKQGIYHYNVKDHCLEMCRFGDFFSDLKKIINQELMDNSALALVITAIFHRTTMKYGDRGYRFVLLDAGHLAQNIYLQATSLGLGCCAVGGFLDHELNELLGLDGLYESSIYIIIIGHAKE
jgi:SagB-type dehydrogenase family enzyme